MGVAQEAHEFLLADFSAIRELRQSTLSIIENRLQFIFALDSGLIALIGILTAGTRLSPARIVVIALALALPACALTYMVFLRALDFQIMGRVYLRAVNAIRQFYVDNYPEIRPYVLMPTDPRKPSFDSIGEGSTLFVSYAFTALVLVVLTFSSSIGAALWLLLDSLGVSHPTSVLVGVFVAGVLAMAVSKLELGRVGRRMAAARERYG